MEAVVDLFMYVFTNILMSICWDLDSILETVTAIIKTYKNPVVINVMFLWEMMNQ